MRWYRRGALPLVAAATRAAAGATFSVYSDGGCSGTAAFTASVSTVDGTCTEMTLTAGSLISGLGPWVRAECGSSTFQIDPYLTETTCGLGSLDSDDLTWDLATEEGVCKSAASVVSWRLGVGSCTAVGGGTATQSASLPEATTTPDEDEKDGKDEKDKKDDKDDKHDKKDDDKDDKDNKKDDDKDDKDNKNDNGACTEWRIEPRGEDEGTTEGWCRTNCYAPGTANLHPACSPDTADAHRHCACDDRDEKDKKDDKKDSKDDNDDKDNKNTAYPTRFPTSYPTVYPSFSPYMPGSPTASPSVLPAVLIDAKMIRKKFTAVIGATISGIVIDHYQATPPWKVESLGDVVDSALGGAARITVVSIDIDLTLARIGRAAHGGLSVFKRAFRRQVANLLGIKRSQIPVDVITLSAYATPTIAVDAVTSSDRRARPLAAATTAEFRVCSSVPCSDVVSAGATEEEEDDESSSSAWWVWLVVVLILVCVVCVVVAVLLLRRRNSQPQKEGGAAQPKDVQELGGPQSSQPQSEQSPRENAHLTSYKPNGENQSNPIDSLHNSNSKAAQQPAATAHPAAGAAFRVGDDVLARWAEDGAWYPGKVCEVPVEDGDVYRIDWGGGAQSPCAAEHVRPLDVVPAAGEEVTVRWDPGPPVEPTWLPATVTRVDPAAGTCSVQWSEDGTHTDGVHFEFIRRGAAAGTNDQ